MAREENGRTTGNPLILLLASAKRLRDLGLGLVHHRGHLDRVAVAGIPILVGVRVVEWR